MFVAVGVVVGGGVVLSTAVINCVNVGIVDVVGVAVGTSDAGVGGVGVCVSGGTVCVGDVVTICGVAVVVVVVCIVADVGVSVFIIVSVVVVVVVCCCCFRY